MRRRIDEVDLQIQALINERATYAQQVGVTKGPLAAAVLVLLSAGTVLVVRHRRAVH